MIETLTLTERASYRLDLRSGDQMTTSELQNEAILVELGIASHPDVALTEPVVPRSLAGEKPTNPVKTETAFLAAVPQTTPWHQW